MAANKTPEVNKGGRPRKIDPKAVKELHFGVRLLLLYAQNSKVPPFDVIEDVGSKLAITETATA